MVLLAALTFALASATPALEFDNPLSADAFRAALKSRGEVDSLDQGPAPKPTVGTQIGFRRWDLQCVQYTFSPEDVDSERARLVSREWDEQCTYDPRLGRQRCWDAPTGWVWTETVWITIPNRKPPFPWETERFRVCLQGQNPFFDTLAAAYDYKGKGDREGDRGVNIVLTAGAKVKMAPDADGLNLAGLDGRLRASFADKWGAYYARAGDKTVLSVELMREEGWFDGTVLKKDLELASAERYDVDLAAFRSEFETGLRAGDKVYLKWSFKRVGALSTDKRVTKKESPVVTYAPAMAGGAAR